EKASSFDLYPPFGMNMIRSDVKAGQPSSVRFQQFYQHIPIYGTYFSLYGSSDERWYGNGEIILPLVIHDQTVMSEEDALKKLLSQINAEKFYWQDSLREARVKLKREDPDATYFPKAALEFLPSTDWTSLNLCYTFQIYAYPNSKSGKYYVHTADGLMVKFIPAEMICSVGSFISNFNGAHSIHTYDNGDEFELEDDCNSSVYGVYDESHDLDIFLDEDNNWTSDHYRSAATSLWVVKKSYFAYKNEFNRDGHDDNDGDIDIYQNHYFSGNGGNFNASFMYDPFGDDEINVGTGDISTNDDDYNALDILGHEFTHGVDQYSAGLEYEFESGALDESFADIFGEWIEDEVLGTHDWFTGAERTDANGCPTPLRYFVDPGAQNVTTASGCTRDFNKPNTYHGDHWYDIGGCDPDASGTDHCGVHTNSGVQNQMFYLLVEGGSGYNNGNTCHDTTGSGYYWEVSGIGLNAAIQIGYFAHVIILGPNSDYQDARNAWVTAATLLYGECSNEAIQAGKAWYAVGLAPPTAPAYFLCNVDLGSAPITLENASSVETQSNCEVTILPTGNQVLLKAGTFVKLRPGFHAILGSVFRALLTDCEYAYY
ncbi:MAG: M4 family metallopeptidase, partial [Saprospiraceae bacterium]